MRTVFLLAVIIVLFVDAFFFSGANTQTAYARLVAVAEYLVSLVSDTVDAVNPVPDS